MRGVPLFSPEGYRLCQRGPAWREQYSPVEEARQDAEQRWWETTGEWLLEIEPEEKP